MKHRVNIHQINHIIVEVKQLTPDEVYDVYGIEIGDDGRVTDLVTNKVYPNINDWATTLLEEDESIEYKVNIKSKFQYDDDY